jgi:hypothetical protein
VLELEDRLEKMRSEMAKLREQTAEMERQMAKEIEKVRRSLSADIVPYGAYETAEIVPPEGSEAVSIPVERPGKSKSK